LPYPAELLHGREGPDDGVVADLDMPSQRRAVGEDRPAADVTVVRHVAVDHEQVVVADGGEAAPLAGAAMESGELADRVAVPDLEAHRLVGELQILWIHAQADRRVDAVLAADHGRAVDLDVRADLRAVADGDVGPDHRERADGHVRRRSGRTRRRRPSG
jgi:hypothetical protein